MKPMHHHLLAFLFLLHGTMPVFAQNAANADSPTSNVLIYGFIGFFLFVLVMLVCGLATAAFSQRFARGSALLMNDAAFANRPMQWIKIPRKDKTGWAFQLTAGSEVIATLQEAGCPLSLPALPTTWSFESTGMMDIQISVRVGGIEIAAYASSTLVMVGGATYSWESTSFLRSQMSFCSGAGQALVSYTPKWLIQTSEPTVEISPAGAAVSEIALLTVLGWYILNNMGGFEADSGGTGCGG